MDTTFRINTDLLTFDFLEGIKNKFPHKVVEITIHPADATDFILSNPLYCRELEDRINEYATKKEVIALKPNELL